MATCPKSIPPSRACRKPEKCNRLAEVQFFLSVKPAARSNLQRRRSFAAAATLLTLLLPVGCHRNSFPDVPTGYREFAYVSNGTANTVSVLDLVYVRQDRTLQVGTQPTGIAANPV